MDNILRVSVDGDSITYELSESVVLQGTTRKWLRTALRHMEKQHASRGIRTLPLDEVEGIILENFTILDIQEQYILVVDVDKEWFSPDKLVQEVLLYRYRPGPDGISLPVRVMRDVAKKTGASYLQVGTRAAVGKHEALARLYQSCGLEVDYISLKENV